MNLYQRTIRDKVVFEGVGLHSGQQERIDLLPAPIDTGIVFLKKSAQGVYEKYPLESFTYQDCSLCTSINIQGVSFFTIEHLFSVLFVLKVTNLFIYFQGNEVPVLDGSSLPFWDGIQKIGICNQNKQRRLPHLPSKEWSIDLDSGSSFRYQPDSRLKLSTDIHFENSVIGHQSFEIEVNEESYSQLICSARTFGELNQVEYARANGLLKGASLSCGLLYGQSSVINGPLRFQDEPVRHKILDFLGDMFLFSCDLTGVIKLNNTGHSLHSLVVKEFQKSCF